MLDEHPQALVGVARTLCIGIQNLLGIISQVAFNLDVGFPVTVIIVGAVILHGNGIDEYRLL
ncbi:hypothetical protein D3C75_1375150 [compost metagenome]